MKIPAGHTFHRCPVSGFEFVFNKAQLSNGCPDCGFGGRICPVCHQQQKGWDALVNHFWKLHRQMID